MNDLFQGLLELVQQVDPVLRTLLAGIGIMFETSLLIGLIFPGDTVVLIAATAISNIWEYLSLIIAVVIGALVGESAGFAIGKYVGPAVLRSKLGKRIGNEKWERARSYVERRGGMAIFLSRFLPVLHSLVPVTAGLSNLPYRKFLSWTAPACTLWAIAYASVGWLAGGTFRELSRSLHWAGAIFVAVIVMFLVLVWLLKRQLLKREAKHLASDERTAGWRQ